METPLFARIVKVDASKHEVTGVLAEEAPDKVGEIFDYETSKPLFAAWNEEFSKVTNGASVGNLREMHQQKAAGKFTAMNYDDAGKRIEVTAKVVDPLAWAKCLDGVYTGFSIGGKVVKMWEDGDLQRYTAKPIEGSLVDNPCMYGATFTSVKADGSSEVRKFVGAAKATSKQDYKTVGGKKLKAGDFAYVGDKGDISTWKLPIDEPGRIRAAMARFNQTDGIPASEKKAVAKKIAAAAKKAGIDASEFEEKYAKVAKNLADVADVAMILQHLNCIRQWATGEAAAEGDGSEVPAKLKDLVEQLGQVLQEMAAEESAELTESDPDEGEEEITMSTSTADLAKAGAKHSKETKGHLDAIGAHADGIKDHLDAMNGGDGDDEKDEKDEKEEKMIGQPQLHKIAEHDATLKKMQGDLADFRKEVTGAIEALAGVVEKLAAQPVAPKAAKMSVAVGKTEDDPEARNSDAQKSTRDLIREQHAAGGRRILS